MQAAAREQNPGLNQGAISPRTRDKWQALGDDERGHWEILAEEAKRQHNATTQSTKSLPAAEIPDETLSPKNTANGRRDYAGAQAKTDLEEIRLVRKLDYRIMPILWLMYFFNYVDRGALAQARLNNLEDDLGMAGNDFNVAVSVLVVGYILMQVPSNMLLTRFYPGALYLLAVFYTQAASRVAILYTANMGGLSFANLIAAGIFAGLDGKRDISGWRWLFIVEGVASVLVALASLWLLPDTTETTRWLSESDKQIGQARMQRDRLIDAQDHEPVVEALWSAVRDGRLWLFCAIQNFHYARTSFINFLPTVIHDLNFTSAVALLLACPPYIFACVAALLPAWSSGRFHERTWHITAGFAAAIVGFAAAAATTASNTACFVFPAGAFSVNSVITRLDRHHAVAEPG
ncbi:hypothetical protein DL767_004298 [Monosporascus sp. MG133]|nr:hypothetical protein DL767_004298 [Monosporascus sp. MG133]